MKVDCEGEVVSDSGNCKNDGSDETPKLFMISTSRHENSIQNEPEKIYFHFFFTRFSVLRLPHSKHFSIDIN